MTPSEFLAWRKRCGLKRVAAARALGMSRSMLFDYERGVMRSRGTPIVIPRVVELACAAIEARDRRDWSIIPDFPENSD